MPALIAFAIQHKRLLAYGAAALAVLLALWWAYSAIYGSGVSAERARWEDRQRAAERQAAKDTITLRDAVAEIDTGITIDLEAISNVRTIYRDRIRTVAVDRYRDRDCSLPDGLLGEINAAAGEYAAASSAGSGAVRPAKPSR